mmetsp:Transcript_32892/g.53379  ORF Transcript_32892/g.53379 Transcript_32892/m.53379 type:complete len:84 (-) Transcript_32892:329-580(-)
MRRMLHSVAVPQKWQLKRRENIEAIISNAKAQELKTMYDPLLPRQIPVLVRLSEALQLELKGTGTGTKEARRPVFSWRRLPYC